MKRYLIIKFIDRHCHYYMFRNCQSTNIDDANLIRNKKDAEVEFGIMPDGDWENAAILPVELTVKL